MAKRKLIFLTGWKYYNHALLRDCAPHEDTPIIINNNVFQGGAAILARWTSNWDCEQQTEWWYCIKDTPFEKEKLKSRHRYKINKAERNFYCIRITNIEKYINELFAVQKLAFSDYPASYRPKNLSLVNLKKELVGSNKVVYAAFDRETNKLSGYAILTEHDTWIGLSAVKVDPKEEKKQINAALINEILVDNSEKLANGIYISDGERNINHITNFQNYLVKYFQFRFAYCHLNVLYRFPINILIKVIYPIKKVFQPLDKISIIHKVNSIMKMEKIRRSFREM